MVLAEPEKSSSFVAEKFAEFVIDTDFEDLPLSVIKRTKEVIFDFAGIALAGYGTQHSLIKNLLAYIRTKAGHQEATVLGTGFKTSCEDAAFANSVLSNFLDASDGHYMGGHINDRVVPTALAVAENVKANGKELLTAVALGYEAYIRLAYVLFRSAELTVTKRSPFFVVLSPLAGVIPAGKLLGLTKEQIAGAMGLAASAQIVSAQYTISGGHEKDIVCGQESRRAVQSAFLAKNGILGSRDILEGKSAVGRSIVGNVNWNAFLDNLGTPEGFKIEEGYFKPWPACKFLHASIEAALNLVQIEQVNPDEIQEVIIRLNSDSARRATFTFHSHVNAIFSHPYQVASVLVDGKHDLPIKWHEKVQNPKFINLLKRTKIELDEEFEKIFMTRNLQQGPWPSTVKVRLRDGRSVESTVLSPKGDPATPLSDEDLKIKIKDLTQGFLEPPSIDRIWEKVNRLEQLDDLGEFIDSLIVPI